LTVTVHYDLYDGLPVIGKWLTIHNRGPRAVTVDRFVAERLAMVEAESAVDERAPAAWRTPAIDVFSDYMFKGMDGVTANRVASWQVDPAYRTQVHFGRQTPCVLLVQPPVGPGAVLEPNGTFESFRSYLILHDATDRERQGLTLRRVFRALAPWTTENPIMMHVRDAARPIFRRAV